MSLVAAALAGLAVLAKGLIGLVLPGAVLFIWLVAGKRWRGLKALVWPPALLLFAAVAVPWFWLMQTRFSGFYDYFFVYQHFQRFAAAGFNNAQPFWFYLPVIVGLALPWSLWGGGILRKTFWTGPTREPAPAGGYLGGGHSGVLLAAGVQAGGLCAADLPPLAFLLAEVVVAAWRNEHDTITPRLVRISASAGAFICVLAVGIAGHNARGSAEPLADVIRPQLQADDTFVSLHAYPFDLALYMRAPKPSWVVDDWLNPEIPIRDNWRKELLRRRQVRSGGGQAGADQQRGIQGQAVRRAGRRSLLGLGQQFGRGGLPGAVGLTPAATSVKFLIWKVEGGPALRQRVCGGTPKAG